MSPPHGVFRVLNLQPRPPLPRAVTRDEKLLPNPVVNAAAIVSHCLRVVKRCSTLTFERSQRFRSQVSGVTPAALSWYFIVRSVPVLGKDSTMRM
jgi:hypothetical protein